MSANNPYNSGNVPYGSRVEELFRPSDGASIGQYKFENFSFTRPGKVVERPDQLGAPNGWTVTRGFETGTAVVQIATSSTTWPPLGAYFSDDFGYGTERWVITDVSPAFEMQGYFKANVNIRLDSGAQNFAPA